MTEKEHGSVAMGDSTFEAPSQFYVRWALGGDGSLNIRKWSQFPFDGATEYASPQPAHGTSATERVPEVQDRVKLLEEEVARLEDDLQDALQVPWPEWADNVVKLARRYSGYDGYDDATDGIDIVGEVDEALSELYSENERLREKIATPLPKEESN